MREPKAEKKQKTFVHSLCAFFLFVGLCTTVSNEYFSSHCVISRCLLAPHVMSAWF